MLLTDQNWRKRVNNLLWVIPFQLSQMVWDSPFSEKNFMPSFHACA